MPAKDFQRKQKSDFDWVPEGPKKSSVLRDSGGSVITQPRNFLVNGPKKGPIGSPGTLLSGVP